MIIKQASYHKWLRISKQTNHILNFDGTPEQKAIFKKKTQFNTVNIG